MLKPTGKLREEPMSPINIRSVVSYAVIATVAAGLSALSMREGQRFISDSLAQPAAGGVQQILSQPLADLPGREVRVLLIERPPGGGSPPHRHPGHHTFGYVIEGNYEFAIDGQPPRLLKTGDTFYEPPTAIHSISRNPSTDHVLKMIVFMVADQKNPTTVRD